MARQNWYEISKRKKKMVTHIFHGFDVESAFHTQKSIEPNFINLNWTKSLFLRHALPKNLYFFYMSVIY